MSDDMRLLALTYLRTALERRDWRAVDRAYTLLGGVGAGEPGKGAHGQKNGVGVAVEGVGA